MKIALVGSNSYIAEFLLKRLEKQTYMDYVVKIDKSLNADMYLDLQKAEKFDYSSLKTAEELYNPNRKELKFYAAGHKAKYGLIDQEENKGILNYYNSMKELKQEKWKEKIERMKPSNFKQRIVRIMRGGE